MNWNVIVFGLVFATSLGGWSGAYAQGSFVNLDFEAANVADLPYPTLGEAVYITNGVPGWNISPTAGVGIMAHNSMPIGGAAVVILGPTWPSNQILQGSYTVELFFSTEGPPTTPAIFQTGLVPLGTKSVSFYAAGSFGLSFAGQQLLLAVLQRGTKYTVYGADISAFAGQTGELRFEGGGLLDNIVFSSQAIPEPGAAGLMALGALISGRRFLRGS